MHYQKTKERQRIKRSNTLKFVHSENCSETKIIGFFRSNKKVFTFSIDDNKAYLAAPASSRDQNYCGSEGTKKIENRELVEVKAIA